VAAEVRDRLGDELIDELLAGARTEEEIVGPGGLLADLTRRLVERAMLAELTEHLGYEPHQEPPGGAGNTRICRARHMRVHVAPRTMLL
jgi:transposase-like protein